MRIFNTLSKEEEEFRPLNDKVVGIYQCGPTVYWTQHIGNMRAAYVGDIVHRTMEYMGYEVNFTRNYTDVGHLAGDNDGDADSGEDRMDKAAKREGLSPQEIADKYTKQFDEDTKKLNILSPTHSPKASDHIQEIQEMIQELLDKGYAYTTELAVYFDVSKAKEYTRLSGQNIEENISGAGKGNIDDEGKKNPRDFALWFFKAGEHKDALQTWPSSFSSPLVEDGEGLPGWHIECSAMGKKYLGQTFDIHLGGVEHIPIHHTNEIAQSEGANDAPLANYWIHYEHLLVDNSKMSKSEGTGYSVSELEERGFHPLSLRYLFLQAHYRSKQNFTWQSLEASEKGLLKLRGKIERLGEDMGEVDMEYTKQFEEALEDDFNTAKALALVHSVLKSDLSDEDKLATIQDFDKVLGLTLVPLPH